LQLAGSLAAALVGLPLWSGLLLVGLLLCSGPLLVGLQWTLLLLPLLVGNTVILAHEEKKEYFSLRNHMYNTILQNPYSRVLGII
jgi:hypothetical protein